LRHMGLPIKPSPMKPIFRVRWFFISGPVLLAVAVWSVLLL
jgi:hypothetical protein